MVTFDKHSTPTVAGTAINLRKKGMVTKRFGRYNPNNPGSWGGSTPSQDDMPTEPGDILTDDDEKLYWHIFKAPTGTDVDGPDRLSSLSDIETELSNAVHAGEKFFEKPLTGGTQAGFVFDVFQSQHTGNESSTGDWSGGLYVWGDDDRWACPYYWVELPDFSLAHGDLGATWINLSSTQQDYHIQLGNFVEDAGPPVHVTTACLRPVATDQWFPFIKTTPWVPQEHAGGRPAAALLVIGFLENIVSAYSTDDTAATLDSYSTDP